MTEINPVAQAAYDVMQEIRRVGERIQNLIASMESEIADVQLALDDDDDPLRGGFVTTHRESPSVLLSNLRPLCELARTLGVPDARIIDARRGEFVSVHDLGIEVMR